MDDIEKENWLQDAVEQSRGGHRDEFNIKSIGRLSYKTAVTVLTVLSVDSVSVLYEIGVFIFLRQN